MNNENEMNYQKYRINVIKQITVVGIKNQTEVTLGYKYDTFPLYTYQVD